MLNRHFLLQFILITGSVCADPITWTAENSSDMNNPSNWNPSTVPGSGDAAIFNSRIHHINFNPSLNSAAFSLESFNFPFNASRFTFDFNNSSLNFTGAGILGNPTLQISNADNGSFPGDLLSFAGGTSGAKITVSNSGTLAGNLSGSFTSPINSNLRSTGSFILDGALTASNTGNDSTIGAGNNGIANTGASQVQFDQSFTSLDDVTVSISNSGTFSGSNSSQGDAVAIVNGSQFTSGAFEVADNFNLTVQNTGNDSSTGVGLSNIGQINAAQVLLQSSGIVGDNSTFTISNTGINSATNSNFIGYLNDEQFFVANDFQAGSHFSLSTTNTGVDTGNGVVQVAVINSNSGITGNQIRFDQGCFLGNHASISASNSGTSSNSGSNVAGMNMSQIVTGDFTAGDYLSLSTSNSGIDSSFGAGGDAVGTVSSDQIWLNSATIGKNAAITLTNSGNYSGGASSSYVNVGSSGGSQLHCLGNFQANDQLTLIVSNSGTNSGTGIGGYFIGDLITGQQVAFENQFICGDKANILITNRGTNSSSTTSGNQVGSSLGYGKQLLAKNLFQAGDDFSLTIFNSALDESVGQGGNLVGFFNNNVADNTASQFHLAEGASIGDRASIILSNIGTYQGANTSSGNSVAVLSGQQFNSANNFLAGDDFNLLVFNGGIHNTSGQSNNTVGVVGNFQVEFDDACTLGNNATIGIINSGACTDLSGTSNIVGTISVSQLAVIGAFNAGTNLNLSVNNSLAIQGDPSNIVGDVGNCQIEFFQSCTLHDGSVIRAFNSGSIGCSQIIFDQGFDVASGKVKIEAINQGTLASYGIDIIGDSAGGNAHIVLENSSLNIESSLPAFTLAGIDGDSTSYVQSEPQLILNTDTNYTFSGVIQDFPTINSSLMKTGKGKQTLSGINTYTGLTTVQEGNLVVNGSLAGNVLVNPLGTLKGNGTILGTLTNTGTISPGESIGTLTVGNFINNNGTYEVEVNNLLQSDLINATGFATLNGGTVTVDGTFSFQQPYTIVTAADGVNGTFTNATSPAFINPLLTYDLNNVYLTLQSALINAASSCNQIGVATNLDNLIGLSESQNELIGTIANLSLSDAKRALESMSGFQYAQDTLIQEISISRFLRRLYDPLRSITCEDWTSWIETGYGHTTAHHLNMDSYQITGGLQKNLRSDLTLGLAGSYEYGHVNYREGKADRDTGYASVYGLYQPCEFYGLVDLVYGYSTSRTKRSFLQYKARSRPHFNSATFYGEVGFEHDNIQPFLGLQVGKNWRGSINESNASGFGLAVQKHNWTTTRSRLGVHISTSDLFLDLAWNQRLSSNNNKTTGHFKDFGSSYQICGKRFDNSSIDYALTYTTSLCKNLNGYLELDGEWWKHAHTFNILGGIEYTW